MKVKLATQFDQFSGRQAGVTFVPQAYGQIARSTPVPSNPKSARQMLVRQSFTAISVRWRNLTELQRTGWNTLAAQVRKTGRFGAAYGTTGARLYLALNRNLDECGLGPLLDPPGSIPGQVDMSWFEPTIVASPTLANRIFRVSNSNPPSIDGQQILVSSSRSLSAGVMKIPMSKKKLLSGIAGANANTNIAPLYGDVFDSILTAGGDKKLSAVKVIDTLTGFPIGEAIALVSVEQVP